MNIKLPVVAVEVTNIARDPKRVFNKNNKFYFPKNTNPDEPARSSTQYRVPVPVNITIDMSIICKFQIDMDQILQNFGAYTNPYIVLSWKVPDEFGLATDQEIRSHVLWSGDIPIEQPVDLKGDSKFNIIANTSFIIEGWWFKDDEDSTGNIYEIKTNFINESLITTYEQMSGKPYEAEYVDTVVVSGAPLITDVFYKGVRMFNGENMTVNGSPSAAIMLFGDQFDFTQYAMLSSNVPSIFPSLTSLNNFPKQPPISGHLVEDIVQESNNVLTFNMIALTGTGAKIDFISFNDAGYSTSFHATSSHIVLN